jgi:hypothetical protein
VATLASGSALAETDAPARELGVEVALGVGLGELSARLHAARVHAGPKNTRPSAMSRVGESTLRL